MELNWSKIRKIGIGLLNLGNNCYLNATLQCLAYTPPLSQWLVFKPHSPMCKFKQLKGLLSCEPLVKYNLDYTIEFKLSINDSTEMWKYLYHLDLPRQLPCFALYNAIHAT